jgi:uncharacterized membrane protein
VSHVHHDHSSHHRPSAPITSQQTRRVLAASVAVLVLGTIVGILVLRADGERPAVAAELGLSSQIVDAKITSAVDVPCAGTAESDGVRCTEVSFEVTSGDTAGETASFQLPITESTVDLHAGDAVTLGYQAENDPGARYFFNDYQRRTPLLWLAVLFAAAVLALGRLQGLRALIALGITGVVIVAFMFPAILDGQSPAAVAIVSAAAIALVALYLTHGVTEMITVALLGTIAALVMTAVLAGLFAHLAKFTGFSSEDAFYLSIASADVDVRGLVLAGIIIGSLGVLDDVTVTQVSAVWQLHEANPRYSARRLYGAGIVIGRDHIASTVNTLVLAYAGAALPLLLVFTQAGRALGDVAAGELVAVEIVRTLVGSIGLVMAVPLTTALAAFVVTRGSVRAEVPRSRAAPVEAPARATNEDVRGAATGADDRQSEPTWEQFGPDADEW